MTCTPFSGKDSQGNKVFGFACSRGKQAAVKVKKCAVTGCDAAATKLCDFVMGVQKTEGAIDGVDTCDRDLCQAHAHNIGPNRDYCPAHYMVSKT